MARIQEPPGRFDTLKLVTVDVDPRDLVRLAWSNSASHCRFSCDALFRFDAPDQSYGVMYAAFDVATAFAETVVRDSLRKFAPSDALLLDYAEVEDRMVVNLGRGPALRSLRLIQLFDEGLAAAHTDNQISARDHYPTTQRWSLALHSHPIQADGIVYMSRYMGSTKSVALFDRCRDVVAVRQVTPLLEHLEFARLVTRFNLAIDPPY